MDSEPSTPPDGTILDTSGKTISGPTVPDDPLAVARVRGFYAVLSAFIGLAVYSAISPGTVDISVFGFLAGVLLALAGLGSVVKVVSFTGRK